MATYRGTEASDNFTGANRGTYYSDSYYTYGGNDFIDSDSGDDYIDSGLGNDTIQTGDGADNVTAGGGNDTIYGDLGNDTIYGGDNDDTIDGGLQDDFLYGGNGNDAFVGDGLQGWDRYDGGAGYDTIRISTVSTYATTGTITIQSMTGIEKIENLHQGTTPVDIYTNGSLDLSLVEVDRIRQIRGSASDQYITGTSHSGSSTLNDKIDAKEGNDFLTGGLGNDDLTGGAGADHFIFATASGTDVVRDFNELNGGGKEGDTLQFALKDKVGTFVYRGDAAFTGGSDNSEARISGTNVLVDTTGDGVTDITITLDNLTSATQLATSDFTFV